MSSSNGDVMLIILALFFLLSSTVQSSSSPRGCSDDFSLMTKERNITQYCVKLTSLGAEFGWNYHNESRTLDILFGAKLNAKTGWLAWGVNPGDRPQMVGTRALIGIKQPDATLVINTYNITSDIKLGCHLLPSKIDVDVHHKAFDYWEETHYFTIHATLILPSAGYNISRLNHVWQVGYYAEGTEPKMHHTALQNVDSTATINLLNGTSQSFGHHRHYERTMHGALNIIGWGAILPTGVIIARYFRKFPFKCTWWYRFHISCQIVGYFLGTIGFSIGLRLGSTSKFYSFKTHRLLAIFIFTFTTLQMFALRLKPKATDEYRKYWDMYHHFLGYALLAAIVVNIFQGIAILRPHNTWKWVYIGLLGLLALIILVLEIITWIKFFVHKLREANRPTLPNPTKIPTENTNPPGLDSMPGGGNPNQGPI